MGATVVRQTSDGGLMVIEFNGKPPHKRRFISPEDEQAYARYAPFVDSVLVATSNSRNRVGPPGKNLPTQRTSFERIDPSDISRFARFEESERAASATHRRFWRGAPGKGHPRARR
tara:strand:+ start:2996 stop:3343 length:348 start_codon:yes stop_codon:yes gene_type:complete